VLLVRCLATAATPAAASADCSSRWWWQARPAARVGVVGDANAALFVVIGVAAFLGRAPGRWRR
jgi:hypothetical protein